MLRWPRKRPLLHARDILPLPSEPRSCMPSAGVLVCSQRGGHAAGRDLLQREMHAGIRVSAPRPPAPRSHRHGGAHPAAGRPPRLLATLFTPPGDSGWSFLFCSDARPCESTNTPPLRPDRQSIRISIARALPPCGEPASLAATVTLPFPAELRLGQPGRLRDLTWLYRCD